MESQGLPEAGGVAWTEVWGQATDEAGVKHDVRINLTARGADAEDALRQLMHALGVARDEFKMAPYQKGHQAAPAAKTAASPAAQPAPAAKPKAGGELIYKPDHVLAAVKVAVEPRPDGKAKVEFYGAGHVYPDLSTVRTPEQLNELFAPVNGWTPDHFKTAATYDVAYNVTWRESDRLNSKRNPYKDVVAIEGVEDENAE